MKNFLATVKPIALILGENELWPGYLSTMKRLCLKPSVAIVSGRFHAAIPGIDFSPIGFASMQTGGDLSRFLNVASRANIAKMMIGGDWKILPWVRSGSEVKAPENPTIDTVFVSMHMAEWASLCRMVVSSIKRQESVVLVPRRLEEVETFRKALIEQELTVVEWPLVQKGAVSMVNKFGLTKEVFAISKSAIIGGSFSRGLWRPRLLGTAPGGCRHLHRALSAGQKEKAAALVREGVIVQLPVHRGLRKAHHPDAETREHLPCARTHQDCQDSYQQFLEFLRACSHNLGRETNMKKLILATPRGFCAGVDRAIHVVEKALEKFGPPIYVRHEIVHNKFVVDTLKEKGVLFVDEVDEVPEGSVVIFSAHGVAEHIYSDAEARHLKVLDASCPLVLKVHYSAKRHYAAGRHIILIGHAGHAEVEGTLGQLPEGAITLIQNEADVATVQVPEGKELAYITQTTLSVAETRKIIEALKTRFPNIIGPDAGDLCYATGNRQAAVLELCKQVDMLLVVGAKNSSNSSRLMELGLEQGIKSHLIADVDDLDPAWFDGIDTVGLSSGASAPEVLVQGVVEWLKSHFEPISIENFIKLLESTKFNLPKELQD